MIKILIPVVLEDERSCEGCLCIGVSTTIPWYTEEWRCSAGYYFEEKSVHKQSGASYFMVKPVRPSRCIKELGGGE